MLQDRSQNFCFPWGQLSSLEVSATDTLLIFPFGATLAPVFLGNLGDVIWALPRIVPALFAGGRMVLLKDLWPLVPKAPLGLHLNWFKVPEEPVCEVL